MTDYFRGFRSEALSTCGPFVREGTVPRRWLLSQTGARPPPLPRIPPPPNRTTPRRRQRAAPQTRRRNALWRRNARRQRSSSGRQSRSRAPRGERRLIQRRTRAARGIGMAPAQDSSPKDKRSKMGTAARGRAKSRERPAPPALGPSRPPPDGPRRRAICSRAAVRGRNRAERTGPRLSPPSGRNRPRAGGDVPDPPRGLRARCRRPG